MSFWHRIGVYGALAAIVAGVYGETLRYGFVGDDFHHARPLAPAALLSTFYGDWEPQPEGQTLGASYYRPLVTLSFVADYAIWGPRAIGYHLTNLALLWINGVVAFHLLRRLGTTTLGAGIASAVWLVHPLSAVAAAWVSERTDSIAAVFYLLTLYALLRPTWRGWRDTWLVLACATLALGSKEISVTVPAAGALLLLLLRPMLSALRARWLTVAMVAGLVGLYLVAWRSMFPDKQLLQDVGLWRLPRLMLPVFRPSSYTVWSQLVSVPPSWVVSVLAALAAGYFIVRRPAPRLELRLYAAGLLWVPLTIIPVAGLPNPDIFRLGLLVAFGSALVIGAIVTALEPHHEVLALTGLVIAVWVAPRAVESASFWGPGGWWYETYVTHKSNDEAWVRSLTPEMQRRLRRQIHGDAP